MAAIVKPAEPEVDRVRDCRSWGNVATSLTEQLAFHRSEVQRLEQLQRQAHHDTIAALLGRVSFSARDLWQHQAVHPELAALFAEAGITSARQLGKRLPALGFVRIGSDWCGAIWLCE